MGYVRGYAKRESPRANEDVGRVPLVSSFIDVVPALSFFEIPRMVTNDISMSIVYVVVPTCGMRVIRENIPRLPRVNIAQ